jgi:hypothetical protein
VRTSVRIAQLVAAMLAVFSIGCSDSEKPASSASTSTSASSGAALNAPWLLLDDPRWAVRKANDQPGGFEPLPYRWSVQYNSYITPNTEASVVLAALAGDRSDVETILSVAPDGVSHSNVLGHDAFVLEQKYTNGLPAGTTLFWEDDSQVWLMLTGTSELTREDVLALAAQLIVVTDSQWHEAVAAKLFSS